MGISVFFRPNSIEEVKKLLSKNQNSKLLAGGTDLVLKLSSERECPQYLIDLGQIAELKNITEIDGHADLGSMVTFTAIKESKSILKNYKALLECAKYMGSPQIRNRATIGGNIANGGSAADVVPCVISLGGILVIECAEGVRKISCEDYFKNYSIEKLKENEILTRIILPREEKISGYYKLGKRNALAIARLSVAINLKLEEGVVKDINLCLGAVGKFPFRATNVEKLAIGKKVEYLFDDEILNLLEATVYESIKSRKTMPFKKEAIKGVYKEALRLALEK